MLSPEKGPYAARILRSHWGAKVLVVSGLALRPDVAWTRVDPYESLGNGASTIPRVQDGA